MATRTTSKITTEQASSVAATLSAAYTHSDTTRLAVAFGKQAVLLRVLTIMEADADITITDAMRLIKGHAHVAFKDATALRKAIRLGA